MFVGVLCYISWLCDSFEEFWGSKSFLPTIYNPHLK